MIVCWFIWMHNTWCHFPLVWDFMLLHHNWLIYNLAWTYFVYMRDVWKHMLHYTQHCCLCSFHRSIKHFIHHVRMYNHCSPHTETSEITRSSKFIIYYNIDFHPQTNMFLAMAYWSLLSIKYAEKGGIWQLMFISTSGAIGSCNNVYFNHTRWHGNTSHCDHLYLMPFHWPDIFNYLLLTHKTSQGERAKQPFPVTRKFVGDFICVAYLWTEIKMWCHSKHGQEPNW